MTNKWVCLETEPPYVGPRTYYLPSSSPPPTPPGKRPCLILYRISRSRDLTVVGGTPRSHWLIRGRQQQQLAARPGQGGGGCIPVPTRLEQGRHVANIALPYRHGLPPPSISQARWGEGEGVGDRAPPTDRVIQSSWGREFSFIRDAYTERKRKNWSKSETSVIKWDLYCDFIHIVVLFTKTWFFPLNKG